MRYASALLYAGLMLRAQDIPIALGPNPTISLPATGNRALTAIVSSSISPDGQIHTASDLYLLLADGTAVRKLTNLSNNGAAWVDLSSDGSTAAYNLTASAPPGIEEVHILDTASGSDRKVAVDTVGCIQPLASALCLGCFFSCIRSVHLSPDAAKLVYSASESQPLYVVNADGSGVLHLPVAGAALAASPQRVVSRNGLLVFTTNDGVYTVNLDGSGMKQAATAPSGTYISSATISDDGNTVAFLGTPAIVTGLLTSQIYILRLGGNAPVALTADSLNAASPSISSDGSLVAYVAAGQAFVQRTDGSSPPQRLTTFRYAMPSAVTLSGDGSTAFVTAGSAVYTAGTGATARRLYAPQAIVANGITSYSRQSAPSPGSLIRISGLNLQDDDLTFAYGAPLPTTLGGVTVKVNGQPVPLALATTSEIIAQLPFTSPSGTVKFAVDFDGGQEVTSTALVKDTAPEVLQYVQPFFTSIYAMAFHAGTPTPADQGHPAAAGETLEMYGVGLGAVNPPVDAGMPAPANPPAHAIAAPQVKIGNQNAVVTFAGLAPGQVGIYQVNVIVPSGLKSGSQPVSWSANSPSWMIWVK